MRDISDLAVTQYRMFPIDAIPLSAFKVESALKAVREGFGFASAKEGLGLGASGERLDLSAGVPVLVFADGEAKLRGKKVVIARLMIDARKIVLHVKGTSSQTGMIYKRLEQILGKQDPDGRWRRTKPLVFFEEAQCVVTLEFDFAQFFAGSLLEFLNKEVQPKANSSIAAATVTVKNFAAIVEYRITDETILSQKVTLVPKQLTIEPRDATDPKARRYFTSSPFDSDTHFEILRGLEAQLKQ